MGLFDLFKRPVRTSSAGGPSPTATAAANPKSARELAHELFERHPDGGVNWHEVDCLGLDFEDVANEYDALVDAARVEVVTVEPGSLRVLDLTDLESTRTRIKGLAHWLQAAERSAFGGRQYLLIREPNNEHDASAVAVFSTSGRKVGHISASRAASMAPLLDEVDVDAFRVNGTGVTPNSSQLWVDVPKMGPLRKRLRG